MTPREKAAYAVAALGAMLIVCLVTALIGAVFGPRHVWWLVGYLVLAMVLAFRKLHNTPG